MKYILVVNNFIVGIILKYFVNNVYSYIILKTIQSKRQATAIHSLILTIFCAENNIKKH